VFDGEVSNVKVDILTGFVRSSRRYKTSGGNTKGLLVHLLCEHLTSGGDPTVELVDNIDADVLRTTKTAKQYAPAEARAFEETQRRLGQTTRNEETQFNEGHFHRTFLRWLVIDQQPFREAESESLQQVFFEARDAAHPKSRTTYHRQLMEVLEEERGKFKRLLGKAQWTFQLHMRRVVAYTAEGVLRHVLPVL
jgi:hypothetical protein